MKYVGWIKARIEDADRLKELGVRGSMVYIKNPGIFEHCEVPDTETLDKLEEEFAGFWRGSFSAVND